MPGFNGSGPGGRGPITGGGRGYCNLNDENSSIGRLKLSDDENLLNIEGR